VRVYRVGRGFIGRCDANSCLDPVVEPARYAAEKLEARLVAEIAEERPELRHCLAASLAMKFLGNEVAPRIAGRFRRAVTACLSKSVDSRATTHCLRVGCAPPLTVERPSQAAATRVTDVKHQPHNGSCPRNAP
jgi:hypothetical protein